MRKLALAALVAFAPATSFAFGPMMDIGQQVREVSSAPVLEVGGCKRHWKHCGKRKRGARNRVDIDQRNYADVDIHSGYKSRNDVYIDQRNQAYVDIDTGYKSRNDVYIQQSNDAYVNIR
jgi:hypothetical protein